MSQAAASPVYFGVPLRYWALGCLVVQTTSAVVLTRYSKLMRPEGATTYKTTTLVIMSEFTKFLLSMFFVFWIDSRPRGNSSLPPLDEQSHTRERWSEQWKAFTKAVYDENLASPLDTLKLAVPAIFYTLQNNLIYVALANLESASFQVGYQMKVITTALLSVVMLNRKLSSKSWLALFLLTFGIILTQLESSSGPSDSHDRKDQNFTLGIISVIICGFCSAFAGVYFEKILKGTAPSVWMRNLQLAFFSTVIGILGSIYTDGIQLYSSGTFFNGYDSLVWILIGVQAAGGLIVAVVVKYADNILKGFAAALSIILCGLCSMGLFGSVPTTMFVIGSGVVMGATILYSTPDVPKKEVTTDSKNDSKV